MCTTKLEEEEKEKVKTFLVDCGTQFAAAEIGQEDITELKKGRAPTTQASSVRQTPTKQAQTKRPAMEQVSKAVIMSSTSAAKCTGPQDNGGGAFESPVKKPKNTNIVQPPPIPDSSDEDGAFGRLDLEKATSEDEDDWENWA